MGFWRGLGNVATFGAIDKFEANEIKEAAESLLETAQSELEKAKENTQGMLAGYGEVQLHLTTSVLAKFVNMYKRIGKIQCAELHKQKSLDIPEVNIQEMRRVVVSAEEIAGATGVAAIGGAAAAAGAYGLAGLIGTASTGTAIATLSGVAAKSATLAWLGGGALSAGGAGMAVGRLVLGGIALAPFVLIAGGLFAAKAKQQLNEAENFYDQVIVEIEKMRTLMSELFQIYRGAELLEEVATNLGELLKQLNKRMATMLSKREKQRNEICIREYSSRKSQERAQKSALAKCFLDIFSPVDQASLQEMSRKKTLPAELAAEISAKSLQFSREELTHIMDACNTADLLFKVLKTPLMGEDGAFLSEPVSQILKIAKRKMPQKQREKYRK